MSYSASTPPCGQDLIHATHLFILLMAEVDHHRDIRMVRAACRKDIDVNRAHLAVAVLAPEQLFSIPPVAREGSDQPTTPALEVPTSPVGLSARDNGLVLALLDHQAALVLATPCKPSPSSLGGESRGESPVIRPDDATISTPFLAVGDRSVVQPYRYEPRNESRLDGLPSQPRCIAILRGPTADLKLCIKVPELDHLADEAEPSAPRLLPGLGRLRVGLVVEAERHLSLDRPRAVNAFCVLFAVLHDVEAVGRDAHLV